jgi:hypothetical protein
VVIGLVAEYVNEFSAILGVPFASKANRFRPSEPDRLAALPHVGGDPELRSGLLPHGQLLPRQGAVAK